MKRLVYFLGMAIILASSLVAADTSYCEGHVTTSDAVYNQTIVIDGKSVAVYKTDPTVPLCDYDNFCERQGMNWYAPDSGNEADTALNAMRAIDNWHTWIINKAPTVIGSGETEALWNEYPLSEVDGPTCVQGVSDGFSAIRDWGCSFCDPTLYGTTRCWDSGHEYDWIMCQGEYQENGDDEYEVPEFGAIAALTVLGLAGLFIYRKRK